MNEYQRKHVINLNPWDISTVQINNWGWEDGDYQYFHAEYIKHKDPRILISNELYEDRDRKVFVAPNFPYIGAHISLWGIEFVIRGFHPRYDLPSEKWTYDIVAEKI